MHQDAQCLEKLMQGTSSAVCGIWVTLGDSARNHTDLNRMFLPVTRRDRAKSLTESSDYPSF